MKNESKDLKETYNYLLKLSMLLALCLHFAGFAAKREFGLHPVALTPIKPHRTGIIDTQAPELPEEPPEIRRPPRRFLETEEDDPGAVDTIEKQSQLRHGPPPVKLPPRDFTRVYDEPPVAVRQINPRYPRLARMAQLEGTVYVTAYIDTSGNVVRTEIAQSAHEILDRAAANAIAQWHFTPARIMDNPVAVMVEIRVVFSLRE